MIRDFFCKNHIILSLLGLDLFLLARSLLPASSKTPPLPLVLVEQIFAETLGSVERYSTWGDDLETRALLVDIRYRHQLVSLLIKCVNALFCNLKFLIQPS